MNFWLTSAALFCVGVQIVASNKCPGLKTITKVHKNMPKGDMSFWLYKVSPVAGATYKDGSNACSVTHIDKDACTGVKVKRVVAENGSLARSYGYNIKTNDIRYIEFTQNYEDEELDIIKSTRVRSYVVNDETVTENNPPAAEVAAEDLLYARIGGDKEANFAVYAICDKNATKPPLAFVYLAEKALNADHSKFDEQIKSILEENELNWDDFITINAKIPICTENVQKRIPPQA